MRVVVQISRPLNIPAPLFERPCIQQVGATATIHFNDTSFHNAPPIIPRTISCCNKSMFTYSCIYVFMHMILLISSRVPHYSMKITCSPPPCHAGKIVTWKDKWLFSLDKYRPFRCWIMMYVISGTLRLKPYSKGHLVISVMKL